MKKKLFLWITIIKNIKWSNKKQKYKTNKNHFKIEKTSYTSNKELNNIIVYNLRSKDCAKSHKIVRRIVILNDTKRDGCIMNAYLDQNKNT